MALAPGMPRAPTCVVLVEAALPCLHFHPGGLSLSHDPDARPARFVTPVAEDNIPDAHASPLSIVYGQNLRVMCITKSKFRP